MCAIVYDNIRLSIRHRKYGSITKYKGTRLALVQFGSPQQSCDTRNSFRQASRAQKASTVPVGPVDITGDVGRAKCKSTLLHFRAQPCPPKGAGSQKLAESTRACAQGVYSDPQGKRPVESESANLQAEEGQTWRI